MEIVRVFDDSGDSEREPVVEDDNLSHRILGTEQPLGLTPSEDERVWGPEGGFGISAEKPELEDIEDRIVGENQISGIEELLPHPHDRRLPGAELNISFDLGESPEDFSI